MRWLITISGGCNTLFCAPRTLGKAGDAGKTHINMRLYNFFLSVAESYLIIPGRLGTCSIAQGNLVLVYVSLLDAGWACSTMPGRYPPPYLM